MKYFNRSVKYFISLCVLTIVLAGALFATGMAAGSPSDMVQLLFFTPRGWFLIGAVVVLSAIYPRAGYMTAGVEGDTKKHRQQIAESFRSIGFVPDGEKNGVQFFRAESYIMRLRLRFDDRICVSQNGRWIELEGPRRIIARAEVKLKSNIRKDNE